MLFLTVNTPRCPGSVLKINGIGRAQLKTLTRSAFCTGELVQKIKETHRVKFFYSLLISFSYCDKEEDIPELRAFVNKIVNTSDDFIMALADPKRRFGM